MDSSARLLYQPLTFFVMLLICSTVHADPVEVGTNAKIGLKALENLSHEEFAILHEHTLDTRFGQYVAPNEMQPELMLPLTQNAKPGTLVSVGTQRCFMAAAKLTQITKIHCFDMDLGIVFFDLLNIRLLELAKDRRDFLWLTLDAPVEEWRKRFSSSPMTTEMVDDLYEFWNLRFRINPLNRFFIRTPAPMTFAEMNYLYDDLLFSRVQELARAHAFAIDWINIIRMNQVSELVDAMKSEGDSLSILDLSNVADWTGSPALAKPILTLGQVGNPNTIILQTAVENLYWIFGSFTLTNENKSHLQSDNLPKDYVLQEGTPLNELFSMKISRLQCNNRTECAKFKQELESVTRDWDEYLGKDN